VLEEAFSSLGAHVMGRRMFSGGEGAWEDDPNANGWWGDRPPFGHPVFVLTHHAREPLELNDTTFHFVTEGFDVALERARAAAGEKDVAVAGGASAIQQALRAGAVDEIQIHTSPVLLGGGTALFAGERPKLEIVRTVESPRVTHVKYRVLR
jgi:dihydrofolate reductase